MNTAQALAELGITQGLTPEQKEQFDRDGFFIAENVFTPEEVEIMRAEFDRLREIEGELGGHEVHIEKGAPRLSNLFNKSAEFDRSTHTPRSPAAPQPTAASHASRCPGWSNAGCQVRLFTSVMVYQPLTTHEITERADGNS